MFGRAGLGGLTPPFGGVADLVSGLKRGSGDGDSHRAGVQDSDGFSGIYFSIFMMSLRTPLLKRLNGGVSKLTGAWQSSPFPGFSEIAYRLTALCSQ